MFSLWFHNDDRGKSTEDDLMTGSVGTLEVQSQQIIDGLKHKAAGIGFEHAEYLSIWDELLTMPNHFDNCSLLKLGTIQNTSNNFFIQSQKDMMDSTTVTPVYISSECRMVSFMPDNKTAVSSLSIHSSLATDENYSPGSSHIGYAGIQQHICPSDLYAEAIENNLNFYRLGQINSFIHGIEASTREVEFVDFSLLSIKSSETGLSGAPLCGLSIEQACQIAKYIGCSQKLKSFVISGVPTDMVGGSKICKLVAHLLWYFLDGLNSVNGMIKNDPQTRRSFLLNLDTMDSPITFYKSENSEQWWVGVNNDDGEEVQVACSPDDYYRACHNDLSERLIKIFESVD